MGGDLLPTLGAGGRGVAPPGSQGHSSTFSSFPPGATCHLPRSSCFPAAHEEPSVPIRVKLAGDISSSVALSGAQLAGCPSAFLWSFVPSITAGTVPWGERDAETTAWPRLGAPASDLSWRTPWASPRSSSPVFHSC